MSSASTKSYLQGAAAVVAGFGILTAVAAYPPLAGPTRLLADLIIWPLDGTQSLAAPETRLLLAIGGGVLAGWGVALWLIATHLYPREPDLARRITRISVLTWFCVDSTASALAGAPLNVVPNAAFLAMFLLPLAWDATSAARKRA